VNLRGLRYRPANAAAASRTAAAARAQDGLKYCRNGIEVTPRKGVRSLRYLAAVSERRSGSGIYVLCVETPKTLDSDHQRTRDRLRTTHGKDFDRQYMQIMVEDHDQAVKLFRQEASSGRDLKLKQFAQNTLPTLVRLNFATPAAILREIVRRMVEAVRRR
jgi:hypothetical protein